MSKDKKNTDDLIKSLSENLEPTKPIYSVKSCGLLASAFLLFIVVLMGYIGTNDAVLTRLLNPMFILEMLILAVSASMAMMAAFRLSVPDTKIRPLTVAFLLLPTIVLIALHSFNYLETSSTSLIEEMHNHDLFLHEITNLLLMISLPTALLFYVIGRAAPTFRLWTGYAIVLSTACFAAIALRMFCGMDDGAHLIIYHYLPVLGVSGLGVFIGAVFLRW